VADDLGIHDHTHLQRSVVGSVGDGRALLKAAADLKPDLVL